MKARLNKRATMFTITFETDTERDAILSLFNTFCISEMLAIVMNDKRASDTLWESIAHESQHKHPQRITDVLKDVLNNNRVYEPITTPVACCDSRS